MLNNELLARYQAGTDAKLLAAELGVTVQCVYRRLARARGAGVRGMRPAGPRKRTAAPRGPVLPSRLTVRYPGALSPWLDETLASPRSLRRALAEVRSDLALTGYGSVVEVTRGGLVSVEVVAERVRVAAGERRAA